MKNHRGKIKKCIFCNSNKVKCIKLSSFEFKYILYNKLLKLRKGFFKLILSNNNFKYIPT